MVFPRRMAGIGKSFRHQPDTASATAAELNCSRCIAQCRTMSHKHKTTRENPLKHVLTRQPTARLAKYQSASQRRQARPERTIVPGRSGNSIFLGVNFCRTGPVARVNVLSKERTRVPKPPTNSMSREAEVVGKLFLRSSRKLK